MTEQPYILALVSFAVLAVLLVVPLATGRFLRRLRERNARLEFWRRVIEAAQWGNE